MTYAFEDPQAGRFLAGVAGVCATGRVGLTLVPITGAADDVERVAEAAVDGFVVWTTADDDPVVDAVEHDMLWAGRPSSAAGQRGHLAQRDHDRPAGRIG